MSPLLIGILAFVGVATLVGGVVLLFIGADNHAARGPAGRAHGHRARRASKDNLLKDNSVLSRPLDDAPTMLAQWFAHFGNFDLIFEQADTTLTSAAWRSFSAVLAVGGAAVTRDHEEPRGHGPRRRRSSPARCRCFGFWWRRKRRLNTFSDQLPDALEMMARVLRSGQSLAFGFNAVATEMPAPIGKEFGRMFDEQNLGVAMDDSLRAMCERVPNLDLRFFVTAVILQRQTGGDLSEILDKIGSLIRDRFRILGQVKALTGEGRLSGVVLMAMPLVLFVSSTT